MLILASSIMTTVSFLSKWREVILRYFPAAAAIYFPTLVEPITLTPTTSLLAIACMLCYRLKKLFWYSPDSNPLEYIIFSIILDIPGVEVDPLESTQLPNNNCGSATLRTDANGWEKDVRERTVPNGKYFINVFFLDIAFTCNEWINFSWFLL